MAPLTNDPFLRNFMNNTTLGDLGERRILKEIIPKYATGVGDDCAVSSFCGPNLAITTDPVPTPGALLFAENSDPYYLGWLSVVINVSDLGSTGAKPEVLVASVEVPSTTLVHDFERMLLGIREASEQHSIGFVGGNLKEADKVNITISAVGSVTEPFLRKGAAIGDEIVALGNGGHFWRDVLLHQSGQSLDEAKSSLFRPFAQASNIQKLRQSNLDFSCAMDASDGLLPALFELARSNSLGVNLFADKLTVEGSQMIHGVDSRLLWLGWGDWLVIGGVPNQQLEEFTDFCSKNNIPARSIGRFTDNKDVYILSEKHKQLATQLESERFVNGGSFEEGLTKYQEKLFNYSLPN